MTAAVLLSAMFILYSRPSKLLHVQSILIHTLWLLSHSHFSSFSFLIHKIDLMTYHMNLLSSSQLLIFYPTNGLCHCFSPLPEYHNLHCPTTVVQATMTGLQTFGSIIIYE